MGHGSGVGASKEFCGGFKEKEFGAHKVEGIGTILSLLGCLVKGKRFS